MKMYSKEDAIKIIKDIIYDTDGTYMNYIDIGNLFNECKEFIQAIETILYLFDKQENIINKMAEKLTTPIHSKEWVIKYFRELVD